MARAAATKDYRTFVAGLITEATGLSYPENSARDLDNLDIDHSGKISRRFGIDCPESVTPVTIADADASKLAIGVFLWESVGENPNLNFIVIQRGYTITVYDASENPLMGGSFITGQDFSDYVYSPAGTDVGYEKLTCTNAKGRFWFSSKEVYPQYLQYNPETGTISRKRVTVSDNFATTPGPLIRDFIGVDDGLSPAMRPDDLTDLHRYNLYNQGWDDELIADYAARTPPTGAGVTQSFRSAVEGYSAPTDETVYPSNSQQWFAGRDQDDNFDPVLLDKQDFGGTHAPKGRILVSALTTTRDDPIVGVNYTPMTLGDDYKEISTSSFTCLASFAGRIWFAGDANPKRPSGVYFSRILVTPFDAAKCYQEADPTSSEISDLIDTDGGVIYIPEAGSINGLVPFSDGLLVFATNGVWYIRGGERGFTATEYGVDKLSAEGNVGRNSIVAGESFVCYWADSGIYAVNFTDGIPIVQNLSEKTIDSYYNSLTPTSRAYCHGFYNQTEKRIIWCHRNDLEAVVDHYPEYHSYYDYMLVLDTSTLAFSKYSFNHYVNNGIFIPNREEEEEFRTNKSSWFGLSRIENDVPTPPFNTITTCLGAFINSGFKDFTNFLSEELEDGESFTSYIETGDEILDDLQREKQATYLHSFFKKTENEIVSIDPTVFDKPSGCTVQAKWDWHRTIAGNRWSPSQNAYRFRRPVLNPSVGPFDIGDDIVYTKVKIRGHGRSLSVRYESQEEKDFQLLGFSLAITANAI